MSSTTIQGWLDQLDTIDPFYGDPVRLQALLEIAPTPELKKWLSDCIAQNKAFRDQLLGAPHDDA